MMAVLPSAEIATDAPCWAAPPPVPISLACCVHTPLLNVYIHAAPVFPLSPGPPTMAVLPSADNAAAAPCSDCPTAPVPTSFAPNCENCASAGCGEKSSAARMRAAAPNDRDDRAYDVRQACAVIG